MMLKIRNVGPKDFGSYKCVAQNSLGGTDGDIKLDGEPFSERNKYTVCMCAYEMTRQSKIPSRCENIFCARVFQAQASNFAH